MSELSAKNALPYAFGKTIPVMAGYLFLGLTYGILAVSKGVPVWFPILTAMIVYTGSLEFLSIDMVLLHASPLNMFATAVMVGARHLFYGISMLEKYRGMGWKKFYLIYTTSDETFAVNYSTDVPEGMDRGWFYFWVSLLDQMYWVLGTAVGALVGGKLPFRTDGLDFVMTAMFVSIFVNQWLKSAEDGKKSGTGFLQTYARELIGLGGGVLCLILFGPDRFLIPTMLVVLLALTLFRGKLERTQRREEAQQS